MIESFIDIPTADGQMNSFIVHPDEGGPFPVVLFLMDAPGMREEIRDMSRRVAATGYYVIASNLYYRDTREFNVFETNDRDKMFELMNNVSNTMAIADAGSMLAHAASAPEADATTVATVGYCMSGPFAIAIAAGHPEVVKAAASIHGVRLAVDNDDSPHRLLPQVNAEVYVACAETDHWAPPEVIAEFERAMADAGTAGRVEWFDGTEHGFAFAERPAYVKSASDTHWNRLHALFDRNCRSS